MNNEDIIEEDFDAVDGFATLPDEIEIAGYQVGIRPATTLEVSSLNAYGLYTGDEIVIDASQKPQRVAETLVHEILHAILDHSSMRLGNKDIEEQYVTELAFGLTTLLARHDALVDFIRNAYEGQAVVSTEDMEVIKHATVVTTAAPLNHKRSRNRK